MRICSPLSPMKGRSFFFSPHEEHHTSHSQPQQNLRLVFLFFVFFPAPTPLSTTAVLRSLLGGQGEGERPVERSLFGTVVQTPKADLLTGFVRSQGSQGEKKGQGSQGKSQGEQSWSGKIFTVVQKLPIYYAYKNNSCL